MVKWLSRAKNKISSKDLTPSINLGSAPISSNRRQSSTFPSSVASISNVFPSFTDQQHFDYWIPLMLILDVIIDRWSKHDAMNQHVMSSWQIWREHAKLICLLLSDRVSILRNIFTFNRSSTLLPVATASRSESISVPPQSITNRLIEDKGIRMRSVK